MGVPRAVTGDQRIRGVAARIKRQQLYFRKPSPVVTFVLEKSALTKPIGGPDVLRKNLLYVRECADLRNVTIQVMPEDRWTHAGLDGSFTFKSSFSGPQGGDCVEVAACPHSVHVRDSKDLAVPSFTVSPAAWSAFLTLV